MAEMHYEKKIEAVGINSLKILNQAGRIELTGWNEPSFSIRIEASFPGESVPPIALPLIKQKGDCIHIIASPIANRIFSSLDLNAIADKKDEEFDNADGDEDENDAAFDDATPDSSEFKHINLRIFAPVSIGANIKALNGLTCISNISGSLRVHSLNGSVRIESCNGDIKYRGFNGPLILESGSPCSLNARSLNGPLKIFPKTIRGKYKVHSQNGPVRLMMNTDSSVSLNARSISGHLKISSAFTSNLKSHRRFEGSLNEAVHPIQIRSVSGPVTVMTTFDETSDASEPRKNHTDNPVDSSDAIIERMQKSGKISDQEAETLRKAVSR